MVTALYRRYRPENFAEMIGQSQVTDPLMTALRTNRVNHAYLFSGPRGCGKTTSARILARCLNCAQGPTDNPCGVCPSCVELSRDGSGSLDVVEIDAASHGGVDDARDLRERAVFAPARDRYKIFIIDEAHMVTSGGFNALLKIVEEPPEHIKFIFATTEPDKVIGTIRSRTHHYPFRLIPPAQLLEYVQQLCEAEGVEVAPGVLPLVVRAGGGSARDTLSLLDQLIAGSENNRVEYERAVALLGYTHGALLSEVVDALGTHDGAAVFDAVDRVVQTGQDPRRFVEDLLERLRDIIIVSATREQAASVLRGVPADDLEVMRRQALLFGHAELSRVADIVNATLSEMTGATSPRLHLELMAARALVPASDDTERGALARVERLERRIGVDVPDAGVRARPAAVPASAPAVAVAPPSAAASAPAVAPDVSSSVAPVGAAASGSTAPAGVSADRDASTTPPAAGAPVAETPSVDSTLASAAPAQPSPAVVEAAAGEVTLHQLKDAWPEILEAVQKAKMTAWLVVYTAQVRALEGDVLTLAFPSENDVASFKERSAPGQGVSEFLRQAILDVLGLRVKYIARVDTSLKPHEPAPESGGAPSGPAAGGTPASTPAPDAVTAPPAPSTPAGSTSASSDSARPTAASSDSARPTAASSDSARPTAASSDSARPTAASSASAARAGGQSVLAPRAAPASRPAQVGPAASRPAQAAPTTSWDVVAIPTSSFDDDVPPADEPMPSDEPELPADRADRQPAPSPQLPASAPAVAPGEAAVSAAAPGTRAPAAASPAGAPASATLGAPTTPAAPTAPASPATSAPAPPAAQSRPAAQPRPATQAGGRARYGEAVVREILQANFIEEQPLPGREG